MITVLENSLKNKLDAANPNVLADGMRIIKIGDVVRALPTYLRKKNPDAAGVSPHDLATLDVLQLPDDAKALSGLRAYARAGAGALGELTVAATYATPIAGQVAVTPAGNLAFLAADAYTDVDVVYIPEKYDLLEFELTVTADVLTLPPAATTPGVIFAMEVEATVATSTGKKIILAPGAGAPAAGQSRLNLAKTTITFAAADVVTKARVKLAIAAHTDVDALLTAPSTIA
jgi:hypothetical protein